jgi:1-acyl-sn-glycerol-3-phosphate acyltransferase
VVVGPVFSPRDLSQQELGRAVHEWMKDELLRL